MTDRFDCAPGETLRKQGAFYWPCAVDFNLIRQRVRTKYRAIGARPERGEILSNPGIDSLARLLAAGKSRRAALKALGAMGLGLAASSPDGGTHAARRPTPTPQPPRCPGQQQWNGQECVCLAGEKCGPACCPDGATCCDNACCYGVCYGEELCCPWAQEWCAATGECCPPGWSCCADDGCLPPGMCCSDADCPRDTCSYATCLENHICSEVIADCNLGGSLECCEVDRICHPAGTCLAASLSLNFVPWGASGWCEPWVIGTGFVPNTTYSISIRGFRGSAPIEPIWQQLTADPAGSIDSVLGVSLLPGDQALVTIETVSSPLTPVSCA